MVTAIGGVLGGLTMAIGAALVLYGFLAEAPLSGQFWGWMGGAIGCFFGGGGALVGAVNSFRQIAGLVDWMTASGGNWLDRVPAGYAGFGAAGMVTALAWVSLAGPARYALLLLGAVVVGQAALFWVFRRPYRKMTTANQQTAPFRSVEKP